MKPDIALSINPLYRCNFRCNFCYLTPEQLAEKNTLDLDLLNSQLTTISQYRNISHVDLYGGEITLLDANYIKEFFQILRSAYQGPVNLVTNLSRVTEVCHRSDISLSVSWDADLRQDHHKVLTNIISLNRDIHLLMLASPGMLKWSDEKIEEVIGTLNAITNVTSVEIKPYSSNQSNSHETRYKDFEDFIIKWLKRKKTFNFLFTNEKLIQSTLSGNRNAWSDDHLYITPEGKLAVLEFDSNYNEYFLPLNDFSEYLAWCDQEKMKIRKNIKCTKCEYLGSCLSEHLKNHFQENDSCDGFKGLLDWYKNSHSISGRPQWQS
jgi:MoaA/NifB/PqqE/SkfB family radical SAM enzyme